MYLYMQSRARERGEEFGCAEIVSEMLVRANSAGGHAAEGVAMAMQMCVEGALCDKQFSDACYHLQMWAASAPHAVELDFAWLERAALTACQYDAHAVLTMLLRHAKVHCPSPLYAHLLRRAMRAVDDHGASLCLAQFCGSEHRAALAKAVLSPRVMVALASDMRGCTLEMFVASDAPNLPGGLFACGTYTLSAVDIYFGAPLECSMQQLKVGTGAIDAARRLCAKVGELATANCWRLIRRERWGALPMEIQVIIVGFVGESSIRARTRYEHRELPVDLERTPSEEFWQAARAQFVRFDPGEEE
jgi:hypothetical protein